MKRVTIALALAGLAAGGTALAQQAGWGGDMTRADATAKAAAMFEKLDVNHDGKLDKADRAAQAAKMFDRIDTDHNGQISRDEFMAAHDRGPGGMEHGMEHGPDGMMPPPPPEAAGGPGPMPGHPMGHGRMGHGRMGAGPMMAMAHMADTNHDGAISKDEFVAGALKLFDAADTNHDGKVTKAEREAAHKTMMQKWRAMRGAPDMPPPPPPPAG